MCECLESSISSRFTLVYVSHTYFVPLGKCFRQYFKNVLEHNNRLC